LCSIAYRRQAGRAEHQLEFSTTRGSELVAIYLEVAFEGMLVCDKGLLDMQEGNWLYKPDDLKGELLAIQGVEIKYIKRKT
jgi:hypothetical protein